MAPPGKHDSRRLAADLLILSAVLLLLWAPFLFQGLILYTGDTFYYFYPFRFTLFKALQQGYFPSWESAALSGNPFCADPQANCFYPLSLLYLLPDFFTAYHIALACHLLILAVGIYLWCRWRRHSSLASLIAAVVLAEGGVALSMINRLDKLESFVWWPWAMLGLERIKSGRRGGLALLVTALSLSFFAGGLELWGMLVGALVFWGIGVEPSGGAAGRRTVDAEGEISQAAHSDRSGRSIARTLAILGLALFLVFLITAPQWLPFRQLLSWSTRAGGLRYEKAVALSMAPAEMWAAFLPHIFFKPASGAFSLLPGSAAIPKYFNGLYFGLVSILAILTALTAALRRQEGARASLASFVLLLLGLFFAFGSYNPLYRLIFELLSPLRAIRYPSKFVCLSVFFCAPLVASGLDIWQRKWQWWTLPAACGACFGLVYHLWPALFKGGLAAILASSIGSTAELWAAELGGLESDFTVQWMVLLAFGGIGLVWARGLLRRGLAIPTLVVLVALDLWSANWGLNPPTNSNILRTPPAFAKSLLELKEAPRIHVMPVYSSAPLPIPKGLSHVESYQWLWQLLYPNTGLLSGISYADGSRALRPENVTRFFASLKDAPPERQVAVASIAGVDAIVTLGEEAPLERQSLAASLENPAEMEGLSLLKENGSLGMKLWRLEKTLPRAYLVSRAQFFQSRADLRQALLDGRYQPTREVGLVGSPSASSTRSSQFMAVQMESFDGGKRRAVQNLSLESEAYLVISETWFPGWTAFVDGAETEVQEANGYQQAVKLPRGAREVTLEYALPGRWLATLLCLMGLFLLLPASRRLRL